MDTMNESEKKILFNTLFAYIKIKIYTFAIYNVKKKCEHTAGKTHVGNRINRECNLAFKLSILLYKQMYRVKNLNK